MAPVNDAGAASTTALWEQVASAAVLTPDLAAAALFAMEQLRTKGTVGFESATARIRSVAGELGRHDLAMRAQLIDSDIVARGGGLAEASRSIGQIRVEAESRHELYVLARCHFLLSGIKYTVGDLSSARTEGLRCVEFLPDDAPDVIRLAHLVTLAIAYSFAPGSYPHFERALTLAAKLDDPWELFRIHSNIAYTAWGRQDRETAVRHTELMVAVATDHNLDFVAAGRDTAARVYSMVGRYDDAIAVLAPVVTCIAGRVSITGADKSAAEYYVLVECMISLAEAYRLKGDLRAAAALLDQAAELATERGLARTEVLVLEEQSKLYAARGEFERAYATHTEFYRKTTALRTEEEEANARTLGASLDLDETRKDVERLRELAMRDALTGLYNRRYLDELLGKLAGAGRVAGSESHRNAAGAAGADDAVLSVAIIDVDHFKLVNDTYSHAAGDRVLRKLADLMASQLPETDTLGRLGGEEFLVLMPGVGQADATARCEELRVAVARHDWLAEAGHLHVTISIGLVTVRAGRTSPSAALSDADRNLYAAKRSGRDRVVASGPS